MQLWSSVDSAQLRFNIDSTPLAPFRRVLPDPVSKLCVTRGVVVDAPPALDVQRHYKSPRLTPQVLLPHNSRPQRPPHPRVGSPL
jgi:hypothetical protein